jgi:hypothetical protein
MADQPDHASDARLDIADLFAFRGETGTVLVMDVNSSLTGEGNPDGFHSGARYEFKIDSDRDAVEDITYRVTFDEPDDAGRQAVELRRLTGPDAKDPVVTGALLARGATGAEITGQGGLRLWAGRVDEPFYLDATVRDAVQTAVQDGAAVDLGSWQAGDAVDAFADSTVNTIVLEIPDGDLIDLIDPSMEVGIWGRTAMPAGLSNWRQISRAGQPMTQSLFNPRGCERAGEFSAGLPGEDRDNYSTVFAELIGKLLTACGTAQDPQACADLLANILLPDILPYRIGSDANFGFPDRNGRALTDNVPEVVYSMITNSAMSQGLTREGAAARLFDRFPYLPPTTRGE